MVFRNYVIRNNIDLILSKGPHYMYTKTKPLCVANWKMNLSFEKTYEFCITHADLFKDLALKQEVTLVLCPSPESLASVSTIFKDSPIKVGAQNCSQFQTGPYTGEVSAQSLAQLRCSYGIVGHSERRRLCNETNKEVALKAKNLLAESIIPIICIGELYKTDSIQEVFDFLEVQLEPVFQITALYDTQPIVIAYEPVWSIGTGTIPSEDHLIKIFSWLHKICVNQSKTAHCSLLYGGSVNEKNINTLRKIDYLDGFLIGNASLDFQNFEKIVSLISV